MAPEIQRPPETPATVGRDGPSALESQLGEGHAEVPLWPTVVGLALLVVAVYVLFYLLPAWIGTSAVSVIVR